MTTQRRTDTRNIAIIAHVDHGKTTLVDSMLKETGLFIKKMDEPQEQVLDSNPLEREKGITILAKNTSVVYQGITINIVDTPGHADFGSEVERALSMVDGCILLADAAEGPMPQTRFVLRKALASGLKCVVVINKMDRPDARPQDTVNKVFDLFVEMEASEEQLDFPIIYACGRQGWASTETDKTGTNLSPLFEAVLKHIPAPEADESKPLQMQITMLDYSSYIGRIGIGRIRNGKMAKNQLVALVKSDGKITNGKLTRLEKYFGLERREVEKASAGDIVAVAGFEDIDVGDTVSSAESPAPLPTIHIDEPTMAMEFMVNTSPLAGREGKFVTSRHIKERLLKEAETNVGLKIEALGGEGRFLVSGRGELHLAVLIETMRREGYELAVSRPVVIEKREGGEILEPYERLILDVPNQFQGSVIEILGKRAAQMTHMQPEGNSRLRLEYVISARALMGLKSELLTTTKGLGLMHHSFDGYAPKGPDPAPRPNGVLIAKEAGLVTAYALDHLQDRGVFFTAPGVEVYAGMIIGTNSRSNDLVVNPCKAKALSNMRTKSTDEKSQLEPPKILTLEQALEFIDSTELLEVTPQSLRLRKKSLSEAERRRSGKEEAAA